MRRGERGFALIITLLVTAIIVSVLAEIVFSVHMDTMSTGSYIDYQETSTMARDGIAVARKISRDINDAEYTYLGDNKGVTLFNDIDKVAGRLEVELSDESGRVSINSIVYKNGEINQEYYDMYVRLLEELNLPVSLAETLADWIDSDDSARKEGAENTDYYLRLKPPYTSKGAPLTSPEELYLVKGYGKDEVQKLSEFVTVYTEGKININTAPPEVLRALSADITDDLARNVVSYRKSAPFTKTADIRKVSGFEQIGFNLQSKIIVKSDIFRANITARVGKAQSRSEAVFSITAKDEAPGEGGDVLGGNQDTNGDNKDVIYYYRQR